MRSVLREFTCEPYKIVIAEHPDINRAYLQVIAKCENTVTHEIGWEHGAKYDLSQHIVPEELVRKAFGACLAFSEHELRERAQWRGKTIFGPHIALEALWEAADKTKSRESFDLSREIGL